MNNAELNPNEVGADVGAGKKLEGELTPEELEKLKAVEGQEQKTDLPPAPPGNMDDADAMEKFTKDMEEWQERQKGEEKPEVEKPELTPEEQLKNLEGEAAGKQEEMTRLSESIEGTKSALNAAREKLGLPPTEEDPPSISGSKDKLEKLKAEQEGLEKQKEELISQQEKERLIREEKEKILQEKLDEVFKEFEGLNPRDFESIFKSGKTPEGRNVESKSMGSLDPEVAQSLAKAFKEGIKLLPKILEALPELLKKFDEDLTKEATERVDKKLEEEKQKIEEEQKPEMDLPPAPPGNMDDAEAMEKFTKDMEEWQKRQKDAESEVPPGEIKPEVNPIEGGNIETPKA